MGTTFDDTTEAEREIERAILKATALRSRMPQLSGSRSLALATGRIRLSFATQCAMRFAIRVAAQIHHEGLPTEPCTCPQCETARAGKAEEFT